MFSVKMEGVKESKLVQKEKKNIIRRIINKIKALVNIKKTYT